MPTKEIIIDGPIGPYAFSKSFIRNELNEQKKKNILVKISSLGGAVDDALNIYDQFKSHGNVTAELSAFVASSATLISLGCNHIRMNEFSFYLAHKPMRWVDEWGSLNEDEIEELIQKLSKDKDELSKVTLQLVKMYMKKSGKSSEEIINLMKQETWLTAEEALEWGFIDEIYKPDTIEDFTENHQLVAMITANGYPAPPRTSQKHNEDSLFDKIWKRLQNQSGSISIPKNTISMKNFKNINSTLKVDSLESVDDHVSLNEIQLGTLDAAISDHQTMINERDTAVSERDTAIQERDTAKSDLTNAVKERDTAKSDLTNALNTFDEIDDSIKTAKTPAQKAEAIRNLLSKRPGTPAPGALGADSHDDKKEHWDVIDSLPHNQDADKNF